MSYKQVRPFDQGEAGKRKGMCLANVRAGFGVSKVVPNAWQSWLKTDQHIENVPEGVDVPVFFWYRDADNGHVGVRLANGQFWSDGVKYASVGVYEKDHAPTYRGWSTHLNGEEVVKYVADPIPNHTPKYIYLRPTLSQYAFYRPGTSLPVKRVNAAGFLNPKKWGGITYQVIRQVAASTYEVKSPSLGIIWVWCGDKDSEVRF